MNEPVQSPPSPPDSRGGPLPSAPRRSRIFGLAIVAFILAVVPCCPMVSLLGAMLGLAALRRIQLARGALGGRRLAAVAVIVGFVVSGISAIGFSRLAFSVDQWVEQTMAANVQDLVRASVQGRIDAGLRLWTPDSRRSVSAQDISDFGAQISQRYGRLQRFSIMSRSKPGSMFDPEMDASGVFVFDHGELLGSAKFELRPAIGQSIPQLQLRSILIEDKDRGDLRLPLSPSAKPGNP